jgi:DnaJ-class molecular chaperone
VKIVDVEKCVACNGEGRRRYRFDKDTPEERCIEDKCFECDGRGWVVQKKTGKSRARSSKDTAVATPLSGETVPAEKARKPRGA